MKVIGTTVDDELIVMMSKKNYEDFTEWMDRSEAGEPVSHHSGDYGDVVLDLEHTSQNDNTSRLYRNDCGIACAVSVIKWADLTSQPPTVDEVSQVYQRPNKPMTLTEVMRALRGYGVSSKRVTQTTPSAVFEHIQREEKPVIALVHYPSLPRQAVRFNGSHFITVYGALDSGDFAYRDPLDDGRELYMDANTFSNALVDVQKDGNTPNLSIFVT